MFCFLPFLKRLSLYLTEYDSLTSMDNIFAADTSYDYHFTDVYMPIYNGVLLCGRAGSGAPLALIAG